MTVAMNPLRESRLKLLAKAPIKPIINLTPAKRMPTGSLLLDHILDGGIGIGRITIFWGKYMSLKSTLAMLTAKTCIDMNPSAGICWLATEVPPEPLDFRRIGINNVGDNIDIYRSSDHTAEEMLDLMRFVLDQHKAGKEIYKLIIMDSLAAAMWQKIADKSAKDHVMASGAGKITEFLKANELRFVDAGVTMLFLNQIRANFNQYSPDPDAMPGGKHLEHAAATVIKLTGKKRMSGDKIVGMTVRAKTTKNKLARPFQVADIEWNFTENRTEVSRAAELPVVAQALGVMALKDGKPSFNGNSKYFQGELVGNSPEEIKKRLATDTDLFNAILDKVLDKYEEKQKALIANDGNLEFSENDRTLFSASVDPETGEVLDDPELNDDDFDQMD